MLVYQRLYIYNISPWFPSLGSSCFIFHFSVAIFWSRSKSLFQWCCSCLESWSTCTCCGTSDLSDRNHPDLGWFRMPLAMGILKRYKQILLKDGRYRSIRCISPSKGYRYVQIKNFSTFLLSCGLPVGYEWVWEPLNFAARLDSTEAGLSLALRHPKLWKCDPECCCFGVPWSSWPPLFLSEFWM